MVADELKALRQTVARQDAQINDLWDFLHALSRKIDMSTARLQAMMAGDLRPTKASHKIILPEPVDDEDEDGP